MEAISAILVLWNICLTIVLVLLHKCQKNQEDLLYLLRDNVNCFRDDLNTVKRKQRLKQ